MTGRALALPLLALAAVACAPDQLRLRAAKDLECPSSKVNTTQIDDSRVRATGCGRNATYYCGVDSHGFDNCSREKPNPRAEVQRTAENELLCNAEKIVIDDVAGGFAATGCGRTATYACRATESGHRCEATSPPAPAKPKLPPAPPR